MIFQIIHNTKCHLSIHCTLSTGRNQRDFLQDNVRRLHEIQARCRDRENSRKPQPLRATRESSASTTSSIKQVKEYCESSFFYTIILIHGLSLFINHFVLIMVDVYSLLVFRFYVCS